MDRDFPALLFLLSAHPNQFPFLFAFHHPTLPLWSLPLWRCRWEGSTSGRVSKGRKRRKFQEEEFLILPRLNLPCWGYSCSQPLCHPSNRAKRGAPGHKRSCSAAVTSLLLDTRPITLGRRVKWEGHLEVMFFVMCTTACDRCKTPGQRGVLPQSSLRAQLPTQEVPRYHENWGFHLTCCHHLCCGQQTICQSSASLPTSSWWQSSVP